jgi:hypothetical protein
MNDKELQDILDEEQIEKSINNLNFIRERDMDGMLIYDSGLNEYGDMQLNITYDPDKITMKDFLYSVVNYLKWHFDIKEKINIEIE